VWLELARSQLALNQWSSAVVSCEGACSLAKQSNPQQRFRVAAECAKIAGSLRNQGKKPNEARQIYRHTTALREPLAPDAPPDVRLMQSSEYFELAIVTTQPVEAEQVLATSIQLIRQLADEFPDNGRYRFELGRRYSSLATILFKAGRRPDAEQAWRQASNALDAGIARGKIEGAGQKSGAAWASLWLAGTALRDGRHDLAERGFRQTITMFAQAVQEDPNYALLRDFLGHTHWDLSDLLEKTNRRPEAEPVLRQALQVFEQAANDFSDRPLYRQEQAFTHRKLAQLFIHLARLDDAERHHKLAIDLYARLVADDPKSASYRQELASTTEMLASLLERAADFERAAAERRKALVLHQKAISDFPKEVEFTTRLGSNRVALANVLLKSRKYTKAVELFADPSSTPDQWRQCRDVACLFVRALSTAQRDTRLSNDERKALADIAERRIAPMLTLAVERCPDKPEEQNELAWLLATDAEPLLRVPHAAVALAKLAAKKKPGTGVIWNTLGVAQYRAGDWKAAIEALTKSSQLQGDNSINFLFLAMAEWKIGNQDAARVWFDKAVDSPPNQIPNENAKLRRFRAEAADLLGISEPGVPAEPTTDNAQITTDAGQPTTDN
jgi:tetratricopeptide (TPR) repeat protein